MKRSICFVLLFVFLPLMAFSDEIDYNPVGRLTIDSSYSEMVNNYMFAKTDLFLFENGSVFRLSVTKNKKDNDLSIASDAGIWIGDRDKLVIRFSDKTFNCRIDDNGVFILNYDDVSVNFYRVCTSDGV